jgi:hypothetical protein
MQALPQSLLALSGAGFRMAHLPFFAFAAPWPPKVLNGSEPLPHLEEVTAASAEYDLEGLKIKLVGGGTVGVGGDRLEDRPGVRPSAFPAQGDRPAQWLGVSGVCVCCVLQ